MVSLQQHAIRASESVNEVPAQFAFCAVSMKLANLEILDEALEEGDKVLCLADVPRNGFLE